jgi:hypothetical protein
VYLVSFEPEYRLSSDDERGGSPGAGYRDSSGAEYGVSCGLG